MLPEKIAFVPARGGSKRIPNKNFLDIGGLPIICRTVQTISESNIFDKIIVTTDQVNLCLDLLSHISCVHVAERPTELADDVTSVNAVARHFFADFTLDKLICCIYPTNALLKPETLRRSFFDFKSNPNSTLMGVSLNRYKIHKAMSMDSSGYLTSLFPEYTNLKTQVLMDTYVSNGTFYWTTLKSLLESGSLISENARGFLVDENEVCDLDEPRDLEEMLLKFKYLQTRLA